ncbi:MAG: acetylneuraminic acid synthetase [Crocinitomicaceae bacterium]|nr:acetylneuraminic acid synthetase [Crocinitomicaceae bacterium]|tara:strand:- start:2818 stop:3891 length:1074 start_codon:yes stop_codon:yes gene_type:complete
MISKNNVVKINNVINNKNILLNSKPYVIAEAGVNHEGSIDLAKRLIDEASEGGAQAIKFQTYKADTIASKDSPYYWDLSKEPTRSQHELFKKYDKFWKKEFEQLAKYCETANIEFMSTPFDVESAKFLNDLMPVFKISSSDITNLPFIEFMCDFNKPIILSTGASYLWEIQQTVELIEKKGNELCLMHCVLNYPTPNEHANIAMIKDISNNFPKAVTGYSDHTLPESMDTCLYAWILGAKIIEKHFTHDKSLPGNDHYHAMDKEDLKLFWKKVKHAEVLLGQEKITSLPSEEPARKNARRSLVASCDISAGTKIDYNHLTWKRPAHGISPREINNVIGKKALFDIKEDDILKWKNID